MLFRPNSSIILVGILGMSLVSCGSQNQQSVSGVSDQTEGDAGNTDSAEETIGTDLDTDNAEAEVLPTIEETQTAFFNFTLSEVKDGEHTIDLLAERECTVLSAEGVEHEVGALVSYPKLDRDTTITLSQLLQDEPHNLLGRRDSGLSLDETVSWYYSSFGQDRNNESRFWTFGRSFYLSYKPASLDIEFISDSEVQMHYQLRKNPEISEVEKEYTLSCSLIEESLEQESEEQGAR